MQALRLTVRPFETPSQQPYTLLYSTVVYCTAGVISRIDGGGKKKRLNVNVVALYRHFECGSRVMRERKRLPTVQGRLRNDKGFNSSHETGGDSSL